MKKIIGVAMAILVVAVMAIGCAAGSETPATEATTGTGTQSDTVEDQAADEANVETEAIEAESVFGKVKSIVGNEIELELAKAPFDTGIEGDEGSGIIAGEGSVSQSITITESEDGSFEAADESGNPVDTSEATIVVQNEDGSTSVLNGNDSGEGLELEYTGESKNILIPAGAEIISLLGTKGTLDSIKKGSVLMLTVDDMSQERATASSVVIWE